jgi:AraC-like DNA-binding protein
MTARPLAGASLRRLLRARDLAHEAFDMPLLVDDLAVVAGLSRAHFLRSFAEAFGATPHEYLIRLRMEHAKRALARGASVTEACFDVGFSSLGSFSRTFSARVGVSPRAWQRRAWTAVPARDLWPALWVPGCFLLMYSDRTFGEAPAPRAGACLGAKGSPP